MTKFESQALHVIKIKFSKTGGSGNTPSFIHALWNIGILHHKQATHANILLLMLVVTPYLIFHWTKIPLY